jgi:hypothetical protein
MNNGDIVLLLLFAGAFIVGFVWGTARTLLFLAGGTVVFLIAGHARGPLSGFLVREWTNLSPTFSDMLSMLVLYVVGLVIVLLIVVIGGRNIGLSGRFPNLDRLVGGLLGVLCAVMVVAGFDVILALFYGHVANLGRVGGAEWASSLYEGIVGSQIGQAIHRSLLPVLGSTVQPLLPAGFEEAFGAG